MFFDRQSRISRQDALVILQDRELRISRFPGISGCGTCSSRSQRSAWQRDRQAVKARFNRAGSCESGFCRGFHIRYVPDHHRHPVRRAAPCPSPLQPSTDWEQLLEPPRPAALLFRAAGSRSPGFQWSSCRTRCPFLGHLTIKHTGRSCHPTLGIRAQHGAQKNLMSLRCVVLRREALFTVL